jgi:hypothetical protein
MTFCEGQPYKNLHMTIQHILFPQFLTLFFVCLILFKSTIIFADSEVDDKSVTISSEEKEEPEDALDTIKIQKDLTSEASEGVGEEADIEDEEKSDEVEEIISTEEMEELQELFESKETQERLSSESGERVSKETDIEEEENVIEEVINKAVVEKKEVPEVVKSAIKKSIVENKELPDEVETAIKSTLEKKEETPLSSSVENVTNQLDKITTDRDKAIIKSYIKEKDPLLRAWNILTAKLDSKLGLKLGLAYTSLYQYATDTRGTRDAASGDLDIFGTWSLWNSEGNHPGSLGFHAEYRPRYSSITPANLSIKTGSLWRTIQAFNRAEFSLVEIWWEQHILKDIIAFRIGKLDIEDYFNNYKFNSSSYYFFNAAFSSSPAIAFPESGGGLAMLYQPSKKCYIMAGISDTNGKKTSLDNTFFFTASKYFYAVEFGVKPKFNHYGEGTYSLTLWHREERDEDDLPSDEGFAISLQQEITDKITPFVRYSCSDGDATNIQQIISAGVGFNDIFGRENDVAGIGLAWGAPSDKSLHDQYTMETFYRFQVKKHIQITPGIQLIVDPSNDPDSDVKAVFQIRARITF